MKNTRLVYNDEKNLKIYQTLSPEDFKEFFMTYLTYKPGTELEITDFSNSLLYALFLSFKDKIDYNEAKWEKQAAAKRENGKKGGRPKKTLQDTVGTEFDITPVTNNIPSNEEIENEPILAPQITQDDQYQPEIENGLNSLKIGNNEIVEDNTYMEQKPVVKIAANNQNLETERVQELINTDDDFYTAYSRYIKASIEYINNPNGMCTATSKEMAKERLRTELDKHHITFNKDIMEMINRDINETMKIRDIDVA